MESAASLIARGLAAEGMVVVLTGAGISAESGIPTFRGEEGYWTVGSEVYRPEHMATSQAFQAMPRDVWQWYLYRRAVCRAAAPNPAHACLVALEERLGDRFRLITQNVDGLHLRVGNTMERTYQIHGNIDYMRCAAGCSTELFALPEDLGVPSDPGAARGYQLTGADVERLRCSHCGGPSRPHVLWFDECYDEPLFRFESSLRAASAASLLIIVGTSAATNLPNHVVAMAARAGASIIDINVADNPFAQVAAALEHGLALRGTAGEHVPVLAGEILARTAAS